MNLQWKIGRFAGIDVFVHATFLLIVGWYGLTYWLEGRTLGALVEGVAFILLLFLAVTLHEYGHALTARRFGIKTRDITLYPIGGVARLERMPEKPIQELWVALAGPAVNVVIAIGLFIWLLLSNTLAPLNQLTLTTGSFIERLMLVNISLVLFNLIPAFPMDGGRVLRAALALKMDYVRATQTAARIGQGLAVVFGIVGIFSNPMLILIALFVWMGASQEAKMVQFKNNLSGIQVNQVMEANFKTLSPSESLDGITQLFLSGSQQDFPVVEDGRVVGLITRSDFMAAIAGPDKTQTAAAIMRRDLPQVDSHEMLDLAVMRLQEANLPSLPVRHGGLLVGMLTKDNIMEFMMIRSALKARATG